MNVSGKHTPVRELTGPLALALAALLTLVLTVALSRLWHDGGAQLAFLPALLAAVPAVMGAVGGGGKSGDASASGENSTSSSSSTSDTISGDLTNNARIAYRTRAATDLSGDNSGATHGWSMEPIDWIAVLILASLGFLFYVLKGGRGRKNAGETPAKKPAKKKGH
jgi:hypothetical protein